MTLNLHNCLNFRKLTANSIISLYGNTEHYTVEDLINQKEFVMEEAYYHEITHNDKTTEQSGWAFSSREQAEKNIIHLRTKIKKGCFLRFANSGIIEGLANNEIIKIMKTKNRSITNG